MSKEKNKVFLAALQEHARGKQVVLPDKLPVHIDFELTDEGAKVILPANAVKSNMQTDAAAFEGWAVIIYSILVKLQRKSKIIIDIEVKDSTGNTWEAIGESNPGHYNRFLYRLMKFADLYSFAEVSAKLKTHLGEFYYAEDKCYYAFNESQLYINKPTAEASKRVKKETGAETKFSDEPEMLINKTESIFNIKMRPEIHRQLPVGIFKDCVGKKTAVFTGGASAIDLWGLSADKKAMCIYELKIKENTKVGIISELFFYANLMLDVFGNSKNFNYDKSNNKNYRGYENLINLNYIERVCAIFLVEKMHPLIDDSVIRHLRHKNIEYKQITYA